LAKMAPWEVRMMASINGTSEPWFVLFVQVVDAAAVGQ